MKGGLTTASTSRLWRHQDFLKLWGGQSVSELGSQVTQLALPSVAILVLHAGAVQVGILEALLFLAFPTLGLIAGVWADRVHRRRLLIACDILRMLAIGSIPVAGVLGHLTMAQVYAVAVVSGIGTVFFEVAYQSYLPSLVERQDLIDGNSKLQVSQSTASVLGPAVAGVLIQAVSAATAMAVDAGSYLISVLSLWWIRRPESNPRAEGQRTGFFFELWEGVRVMFGNADIRYIAGCTGTSNLSSGMSGAVYLLFAYHQLRLSPGTVGGVSAVGSVGAIGGALVAGTLGRRLGLGRTLVLAMFLGAIGSLLIPLSPVGPALILLGAGWLMLSFCSTAYNVNQVSLRQAIVPLRLQGRLNATVRTLIWGTIPLGSAIGGVVGSHIGYQPTLYICAAINLCAVVWLLLGPARIRSIPEPAE